MACLLGEAIVNKNCNDCSAKAKVNIVKQNDRGILHVENIHGAEELQQEVGLSTL